jgi:hypothetical protein
LIGRNLVYYWDGLTDLDKEIRKHKKDPVTGIPNAKGGDDNIDSLRYLADVYYRQYYNTYHTSDAENSDVPEWITKRRLVEQAMLERYNAVRREDTQIQGLTAGFDSRYM